MSHHRLLTPAARPRPGTPPAARRLPLILLVFLSLAAGAPFAAAEMIYYTEDFCNDGEPGFDPMFNHEIIGPAWDPSSPMWWINPPDEYLDEYRLNLGRGTKDVITFDLADGQAVQSAIVTVAPEMIPSLAYVKFIGTRGEWQTSDDQYGQQEFQVSYEELGYIQAIELSALQAVSFTTVTIGVIPEPCALLLMLLGFLLMGSSRRQRNRDRAKMRPFLCDRAACSL